MVGHEKLKLRSVNHGEVEAVNVALTLQVSGGSKGE